MGKSRKMDQRAAPAELGAHAFRIEIPDLPTADVVIICRGRAGRGSSARLAASAARRLILIHTSG